LHDERSCVDKSGDKMTDTAHLTAFNLNEFVDGKEISYFHVYTYVNNKIFYSCERILQFYSVGNIYMNTIPVLKTTRLLKRKNALGTM
jgi:hypothetical protein